MHKYATIGASLSLVAVMALPFAALADTVGTNFESFTLGSVHGQQGWSSSGGFDQAIVTNSYGYGAFGTKTLRISDAVTSGSFGDQTYSRSLANEAGEAVAVNGGMSGGARQPHFEAQFDLASALPTLQAGMHVSVSPDRGDGARMSYLRFEDQADGIHIFFDDVTSTQTLNSDMFNETDIATVSRAPHTIKFVMDFVAGPSNDIVKIYVDGVLKATGTSWEDYYRYDSESNPSAPSDTSRTVDSLLFRESGTANVADAGKGFLIDNLSLISGPTPVVVPPAPTNKDQCKGDGWKNFSNPSFKNQGQCVAYTNHN